jgi:hypothetical protein
MRGVSMKLRLVSEGFGIDEIVEFERWIKDDLLLMRKPPRRFEFASNWERDNYFRYGDKIVYEGYLKGSKRYHDASITIVEE